MKLRILVFYLSYLLFSSITMAQEHTWKAIPIPDTIWDSMQGKSVPANCTTPRSALRYIRIMHINKEGKPQSGEIICNKSIANDLIEIFKELFNAGYRIERVELIDKYDANDEKSMEANNTSCFNFRLMTGSSTKVSKHGLGMAIDINPLYNPYVKGNRVEPRIAQPYTKRNKKFPMKIDTSDLCYKLFIKHGFHWGGSWRSSKDYQHFEK